MYAIDWDRIVKGQLHLQAIICWEHTLICVLYCPCSPEYCLASLPLKLHLITTPKQPSQLNTMGAIVSHNALPESIWQPVHDVTNTLPVCRAATYCIVCIWDWENYVVKMVICAAYGCYITDLTREKERGFPFSPFLTQGLYQKRSILQQDGYSKLGQDGQWRTTHLVEPKEFVMNILRNLVLRLNYKQDLDLGDLNAWNLVQRLQHLILIPHRAIFNKREKKGPRSHKKEGQICYIKLLDDNFSLEGTIQWLRKGER